jgi:hypothetical protein
MRTLGIFGALALFLFMMAAPAAYSQDNKDEDKPKAQEAPKPQDEKAKPEKAAPQDERAKQDQKAQDDKARQDQKAQQKEQEKQQKDQAKENKKAQEQQDRNVRDQQRDQHPVDNRPADNRQMDNRPADNRQEMGRDQNHPAADRGRRIPDNQFRSHFGREHTFHVQRTEIVNVSQPTVVYGGYSFQLVDAWPSDWGYDDNCYIDYVDGEYFLFDMLHPGVRIAVVVVG